MPNHCLKLCNMQLRKVKAELSELPNNPQGLLLEAIHSSGYAGALGNPLLAPESALNQLDGSVLEEFVAVSLYSKLIYYFLFILIFTRKHFPLKNFRRTTLLQGWLLLHQELNMESFCPLQSHSSLTFQTFPALQSQSQDMLEEISVNMLIWV